MITIKIETDNDAFVRDNQNEQARILRDLADKLEHACGNVYDYTLHDVNGNSVGYYDYTQDEN